MGSGRHAARRRTQHRGRPCRRHAYPALRLGRRRIGLDHRGARPVQPPAREHPASDRAAAGTGAGAALRPACPRPGGSRPARRARLCRPAVRPGRERRRGARRHRAQPGLPGHRRFVRPPALPQSPAAGAHERGAVRHRHAPRHRRQPALRRGASRRARAQVAARRHLQDGEREARRRDDLRARRDRGRRSQAHDRAAQRLFRGQQDQVPDPRVPRLLLCPARCRRHPAPGVGIGRHAEAGVRGARRRIRHARETRRRSGNGRHRGQGEGHHRRRQGRQDAGGRRQGGPRQLRRRDQARPRHQEGSAARRAGRRHLRPARGRGAGPHPVAARLARGQGQLDRARQDGGVRRHQGEARQGAEGPAGARPPDQAGHRLRAHAQQDPVDEGCRRGARSQDQDLRERRCARPGCVGQAGRDRPGRRRTGPGRLRHARERRERADRDAARRVFHGAHRPRHAGPHPHPERSRGQGRSRPGRPRNDASSPTPR